MILCGILKAIDKNNIGNFNLINVPHELDNSKPEVCVYE